MFALSYTTLRASLAKILDQVQNNHTPILITRKNGSNAVLMSEEDFRSYEETAFLMQSGKNASRLNASISELRAGNGIQRELIE